MDLKEEASSKSIVKLTFHPDKNPALPSCVQVKEEIQEQNDIVVPDYQNSFENNGLQDSDNLEKGSEEVKTNAILLKSEEMHKIKDCEVSLHRIKAPNNPSCSGNDKDALLQVKKQNVYSCPYCVYKNKQHKVFIEKHKVFIEKHKVFY